MNAWTHRAWSFLRGHTHPVLLSLTQTQQNSHSTWLRKDVGMYVHHEVSSCCVLHDKTHMFGRLETCKQVDQEGVVGAVDGLKDPLLTHQTGDRQRAGAGGWGWVWDSSYCTRCIYEVNELCHVAETRGWGLQALSHKRELPFHFVPRNNVSLLQGFDGVQAACPFVLRQQHLKRPTMRESVSQYFLTSLPCLWRSLSPLKT